MMLNFIPSYSFSNSSYNGQALSTSYYFLSSAEEALDADALEANTSEPSPANSVPSGRRQASSETKLLIGLGLICILTAMATEYKFIDLLKHGEKERAKWMGASAVVWTVFSEMTLLLAFYNYTECDYATQQPDTLTETTPLLLQETQINHMQRFDSVV